MTEYMGKPDCVSENSHEDSNNPKFFNHNRIEEGKSFDSTIGYGMYILKL
jgi:hypothetical protein